VNERSTSSHDNKKFRSKSMEKQREMVIGFRKTATAVKKPDRLMDICHENATCCTESLYRKSKQIFFFSKKHALCEIMCKIMVSPDKLQMEALYGAWSVLAG